MAQGRMIKKEITNSEKLGSLRSDRPRVIYFMMLPHLDIKGRLRAGPRLVKGQVLTMLPYTAASIQTALEALHEVGLIVLYMIDGDQYLEYTRFGDFQTLNPDREAESTIPDPTPADSCGLPRTPCKGKSKIKLSKVKVKKYTDEFEYFWKQFKGRYNSDKGRYDKGSKWLAFQEFESLSLEDKRKAAGVADLSGDKYTQDACRWLKHRRFDDYDVTVTSKVETEE